MRVAALGMGLCFVLTRFSELHQLTTYLTGVNLRLLYLFGLPALAGLALSGGFQRTLRDRPARYWTAYLVCMGLAVPFSSWKAGSLSQFVSYATKEFVMMFVLAGLIVTWRECKMLMHALALAGIISVANGKLLSDAQGSERLGLDFGMMANPNDYACHLLLVLPFVLWLALKDRSSVLTRLAALAIVGTGVFLILRTGSRGGVLALAVTLLWFVYHGSTRQRIAVLVLAPMVLAAAMAAAPAGMLLRIRSFGANRAAGVPVEASDSARARKYVFLKSIEYTLKHPLFGVGPAQFPNYEGQRERVMGTRGYYHGTHNTFTQVSSECGIPAMIFFLAGLVSSYRMLSNTYRRARQRPECEEIASAAFCILLGMVGFTVAMAFLNLAYFFYMPALAGLAIAISRVAEKEFSRRPPEPGQPPVMRAAVPPRVRRNFTRAHHGA